ncbi:Zn-dependent exopeptidase [Hyphopichia burtonii NRRL Y-1933]|uniref:Zn-dependent exopeptidase n=1 Tax=Hyphopichia burtonii NRRL Y-1933 TaxID=984485 RepID=A0A1E4REM3_9ASCO|nr:Zn-dependent exopeptidase [Hyphopichia burtonii NRRL Y-1933]ODV65718.1 Zn-dependent exopeptidase [Hyphopichia burtonii NRRL Y-1933]
MMLIQLLVGAIAINLFGCVVSTPSFFHETNQNQIVLGQLNDDNLPNDFENLTDYKVDGLSLLSFHKGLVEIPSITLNEYSVSQFLKEYLEDAGLTVELQQVNADEKHAKPRYNIYAYLGNTRDTKVLVTSHIDTVPPFVPYHIDGTKIYGRGSSDAKGSVAAQVFAFLSLIRAGKLREGDASLLFVTGEETGSAGMDKAQLLNVNWTSAIFGEPTENKLGVGHKGVYGFNLFAHGKASHSGYPHLGISASEILLPILSKIQNLDLPVNDLLGPSTINIGEVNIGVAINVLPENGTASVLIRVADDVDTIDQEVLKVIDNVENLTYEKFSSSNPTFLDYKVPGFESIVLAYGTDVPRLSVPVQRRYLYGPGSILVAHAPNEYVENQSLLQAVEGYKKLIKYELNV